MYILGISAFYHDSAACLIRDGEILVAAQEERFTRKKHDSSFPRRSINYCLETGLISVNDLDLVVFYEKPFLKFERLLSTYMAFAPRGFKSFSKALVAWLSQKLWIKDVIAKELKYKGEILFPEHHESHAASAFYPSPFEDAAFLTVDGVGEWATTTFGVGNKNKIDILGEIRFPHSLGLLYSAFTYYLGFRVNSGEYKVMGLAPYGEPKYAEVILSKMVDLKEDGSFRLNLDYFNYCQGLTMTNSKFNHLFGGVRREPESPITQKDMDIAASLQKVTEEIILRLAKFVKKETGKQNLCLAGGVALNCVANSKVLENGIFNNIWIQPASGDAGGALGAALLGHYQYHSQPRHVVRDQDFQKGSFLGPEFSDAEVRKFLNKTGISFEELSREKLLDKVADLIDQQKVIGWFQGRMEFGPRALGARSIIGDARSSVMQKTMNLKIKFRESFRPFAPSVLEDRAYEYFKIDQPSPYMLLVADVKENKRLPEDDSYQKMRGISKLKEVRSLIPAVTHVDYSARLQTVNRNYNPVYYDLINNFYKKTGCPVIINTSFNVRGEPIVCTPEDAYRCFIRTEIDHLVLGNFIIGDKKASQFSDDKNWKQKLELD